MVMHDEISGVMLNLLETCRCFYVMADGWETAMKRHLLNIIVLIDGVAFFWDQPTPQACHCTSHLPLHKPPPAHNTNICLHRRERWRARPGTSKCWRPS